MVYSITDDDVVVHSGLDAYVFLAFFKMGITIFSVLSVVAGSVLSPARYYFVWDDNHDDKVSLWTMFYVADPPPEYNYNFPTILWLYALASYVFSTIVYYYLFRFTKQVLKTRQKYLAVQDSITDRTIRLDNIPHKLLKRNDPCVLKKYLEDLGIGKVLDIKLLYDWSPLEELFTERKRIIGKLEQVYASSYHLDIDIYDQFKTPKVQIMLLADGNARHDPSVQLVIDQLAHDLNEVNTKIRHIQSKYDPSSSTINVKAHPEFKPLTTAFVTMDSVASAQMAAQTVLDPRVYKLMVNLAPAPKDIIWKNFKLTYYQKITKSYLITFIIILSYAFIIFLVTPLTTLLDLKTIKRLWPSLGKLIAKSATLTTFVTGILPPLLFSLLNLSLPYFYKYLSQNQGYFSNSDIELSTLSKNFFYIFFNLFLVFIVTGTIWDYISYISDTTKIATQLAQSLRKLSLFYVNLILLQGLAMFPVRLLQISDFLLLNILGKLFFLKDMFLRTPRDYRAYYFTPQVFDFGLQLPQHILIFIIILIYSVVNTGVVISGLVYFILGYFVYKYQLVYNFVHPPHSTGKVWPMIFRRIVLALIIFQIFMIGTLALENAYFLSALCSPLLFITAAVSWNFEKYYLPLSSFIALRAILNPYDFDKEFDDDPVTNTDSDVNSQEDDESMADGAASPIEESTFLLEPESPYTRRRNRRQSTIDEERERFTDYTYPYLTDPLTGPWVGFEGDYISMVQYNNNENDLEDGDITIVSSMETETVVKKKIWVSEWE